jgi:hypothetical protein
MLRARRATSASFSTAQVRRIPGLTGKSLSSSLGIVTWRLEVTVVVSIAMLIE